MRRDFGLLHSDIAATIAEVARDGGAIGYAVYTPAGSEAELRALLPPGFRLLLQCDGDFGTRVAAAVRELLAAHAGVILVNADSPTLPASILRAAVDATPRGGVVLSPSLDGGYTLIGLSQLHERLFTDIPWSTTEVHRVTVERAREIGMPVTEVPGWYDVDDARSLALLRPNSQVNRCLSLLLARRHRVRHPFVSPPAPRMRTIADGRLEPVKSPRAMEPGRCAVPISPWASCDLPTTAGASSEHPAPRF